MDTRDSRLLIAGGSDELAVMNGGKRQRSTRLTTESRAVLLFVCILMEMMIISFSDCADDKMPNCCHKNGQYS
jgi:hypothetical protein